MWKIIILILFQIVIFCSGTSVLKMAENSDYSLKSSKHLVKREYNRTMNSKCQCVNYNCGCCVFMKVQKLHLNDSACVNLTYLPKDYGLSITVTIDKWALLNETVSARSPPALCFGEDYLPIGGEICLKFYDLNATKTSFHGCAEIYAKFHHVEIAKYDLGCFDLGKKFWNNFTIQHPKLNGTRKVFIPKITFR